MAANTIYDAIAEGVIPQPVTLMDLTGAPYVASGGGGGSVTINDPTTTSQKLAVDASGKIGINNFPAFTFDGSGYLQVNVKAGGSGGTAGYAATADGIAATNINELGVALYNGTTFDRLRGDSDAARVSLYGKYSVAGDTPLGVDASGYIGIRNFPYTFDTSGNLMTNAFAPHYNANSGGPALAAGTPSGLNFDLQRSIQGKATSGSLAITTTAIGDNNLVFTAAPLTLYAGSPVFLVQDSATAAEVVYVSKTFAPGTGVTTVPLQSPVRYAGHSHAVYDVYSAVGPQFTGMSAFGLTPNISGYWNSAANTSGLQYELVRGSNGWAAQQNYTDYMTLAGSGYTVDTGIITNTTTGTFPVALWNNATKNIVIYSIVVNCTVAGNVKLTLPSSNPAYGTSLTPANSLAGGTAATSVATMTATTTTFSGTSVYSIPFSQAQIMELLPNGKKIYLPGYASKALTAWLTTISANCQWSMTISYLEY
jgi:hypothetical protein